MPEDTAQDCVCSTLTHGVYVVTKLGTVGGEHTFLSSACDSKAAFLAAAAACSCVCTWLAYLLLLSSACIQGRLTTTSLSLAALPLSK